MISSSNKKKRAGAGLIALKSSVPDTLEVSGMDAIVRQTLKPVEGLDSRLKPDRPQCQTLCFRLVGNP